MRDYQHELYDQLHDSPMQQKLRSLKPMPFGVVFLPWGGMTEEDMRQHYRWMKELGFTNLKQTMGTAAWPRERILEVALEEGIIPFWYGEAGWESITDDLLKKLGIPTDASDEEIRQDPRMQAYQREVLRKRISYPKIKQAAVEGTVLQDAGFQKWAGTDIQLHNDPVIRDDAMPLFRKWVRDHYTSIEELRKAWNQTEVGISRKPYESWDDFESDEELDRQNRREYGFIRDSLRFKADVTIERIRQQMESSKQRDPEEPTRAGGEMGIFLPFAWRGTDMEGIAQCMTEYGSFYPSIHLAWHYEEVNYEVARCIYMQASLSVDWFKGGWAATWESTGGPQQFSGGKGWNPKAAEETAGYTVDEGTITQLQLSYLAAGFKGVGLWAWNYRRAGWEAGEYALCNRQNKPGPRAVRAGQIAKAANRFRDEIWQAHKEPDVGVYVDWDNEAIWAAISQPNRDHFRHYPVRARVGATRALINGNVAWEHVTANDMRKGLGKRYRTIYMPATVAIAEDILPLLETFVREGGRLVFDAPGAWFDTRGLVLDTGTGSIFERIFGVEVADYQYSNNRPFKVNGRALTGFVMDLNPTTAAVVERFDHGAPCVTESRLGDGAAVALGYDASYELFAPGNEVGEADLRRHLLGGMTPAYSCDDAIVYRLAAPNADHYFFINDDNAKSVTLETPAYQYGAVMDPITGEDLSLNGPIELEAFSGRWLRFEKA